MHNYVISDIHGNSERLKVLMRTLKQRHPSGDFMLHIIGDIFDRGKNSAGVYKILADNYRNINLLLGNHEMLFMDFMEDPEKSFFLWQLNYAYPTIQSFIDEFLPGFLLDEVIFKHRNLIGLYEDTYKQTKTKLARLFGKREENSVEAYLREIKDRNSDRDMRKVSMYVRGYIKKECPHLPQKNRALIENITYLLLLDKFCALYSHFATLKAYDIVDDKYLLVHSGFVTRDYDAKIYDSVKPSFYRIDCKTKEDLKLQDAYPMLWSRRHNLATEQRHTPSEKFDGLTIIFGHTIVSNFRKNNSNSLNPLITYDANGEIASIGIDGKNYDRENGQLNCICLDDLSLMMVTGSNIIHSTNNHSNPLTISKLPPILNKNHKQHELPEVGD